MDLCKYSNIFGLPGKGLHKYKIFDIAIVDVMASILLALFIYYIFKYFKYKIKFCCVLLFVFLLGILMHRLFCVRTTIDKLLFPHC